MSLVHLRLNLASNTNEIATYEVWTPDFSSTNNWEKLGSLKINKTKRNYKFIASQLAENNKIIPPEIYSFSEKDREIELETKYHGYGAGAWSICINHWARTLIEQNQYPKRYP